MNYFEEAARNNSLLQKEQVLKVEIMLPINFLYSYFLYSSCIDKGIIFFNVL